MAVISGISLGTHLFVKVSRPGDSKETFSVFFYNHVNVFYNYVIQFSSVSPVFIGSPFSPPRLYIGDGRIASSMAV